MSRPAYVTPSSPRDAILNALNEIEDRRLQGREEQLEVLVFHLSDFQLGKYMVARCRHMTLEEFARLAVDSMAEQDDGPPRGPPA